MNLQEALVMVEDIGGAEIEIADSVGMGGAVLHSLVGAVMRGERFDSLEAVIRWLRQHTGVEPLRRSLIGPAWR